MKLVPASHRLSLLVVICAIAGIFTHYRLHPPSSPISYDVLGYYIYLPQIFIEDDLAMHKEYETEKRVMSYGLTDSFYQAVDSPKGKTYKYSIGMSILYFPFFIIAHLLAGILGFAQDGYSMPYQQAIHIGGLIYTCIGLLLMRKVLMKWFKDLPVAVTLAAIFAGTNLYQTTQWSAAMSQNYLLGVYGLILYVTMKWYEQPTRMKSIALGALCGLAVICRPTEIVCVLIPLLWGLQGFRELKVRGRFLRANSAYLLMTAAAGFAVVFIQLFYWKKYTGSWMYYSYTYPEVLDLTAPKISQVLFSWRKGWLLYTPMMGLALAGFVFLYLKQRRFFLMTLLFFVANLWLVSSWPVWWYADSFSSRALIQSYAVMAIPLAAFFSWALSRPVRGVLVSGLASVLVAYNLFQIWQFNHDILHLSRMTKAYYKCIFLRTEPVTDEDRKLLLVDRKYENTIRITNPQEYDTIPEKTVFFDFEKPDGDARYLYSTEQVYDGKYSLKLDEAHPYTPAYHLPFYKLTSKDHAWVRMSAWVYPCNPTADCPFTLVMQLEHGERGYAYKGSDMENWVTPGQWNYVEMEFLTPDVRINDHDLFKAFIWRRTGGAMYVDNMQVMVLEPENR